MLTFLVAHPGIPILAHRSSSLSLSLSSRLGQRLSIFENPVKFQVREDLDNPTVIIYIVAAQAQRTRFRLEILSCCWLIKLGPFLEDIAVDVDGCFGLILEAPLSS